MGRGAGLPEEYARLLTNDPAYGQPEAGHDHGDHRQYGDTHSELPFITVEALETGRVEI